MIRESFKMDLINILEENTNLYADDFNFENTKMDNGAKFRMVYFYNNRYYFEINIEMDEIEVEKKSHFGITKTVSNNIVFDCNMCPGMIFDNYQEKEFSVEGLHDNFGKWVKRVEADIKATSLQKKIDKLTDEFDSFKISYGDSEKYFTNEDAQKFEEKMKKLEELLTSHLNEDDDIPKEIIKIRADIDSLTDSIYVDSKSVWTKKFYTRFKRWMSNPNNQQKVLETASQVKVFLENSNAS